MSQPISYGDAYQLALVRMVVDSFGPGRVHLRFEPTDSAGPAFYETILEIDAVEVLAAACAWALAASDWPVMYVRTANPNAAPDDEDGGKQ